MPWPLNISDIAFTLLGYPMSYLELVGTLLYLWSAWLIARRRMLTWPVGILSVILYGMLFYQIRLYSDTLEQVYYLFVSVYGWWHWRKTRQEGGGEEPVGYGSPRSIAAGVGVTAVLSYLMGVAISRMHLLLPDLFPEPASFPYLDAVTTVMSFTAMWLLARRRTESWYYWIVVDIIGIGLYYAKDVRFVALLYVALLVVAVKGLMEWTTAERRNGMSSERSSGIR